MDFGLRERFVVDANAVDAAVEINSVFIAPDQHPAQRPAAHEAGTDGRAGVVLLAIYIELGRIGGAVVSPCDMMPVVGPSAHLP